jgi:hypothetical protein
MSENGSGRWGADHGGSASAAMISATACARLLCTSSAWILTIAVLGVVRRHDHAHRAPRACAIGGPATGACDYGYFEHATGGGGVFAGGGRHRA